MTSIKSPSIRTSIFLALVAFLSTVALVDAAASSGCGTKLPSGYTPGGDSVSATLVTKDGTTRSYLIYIPTAYVTNTPAPLIFNFHGRASSGAEQQRLSRMNRNAQNKNSIVVSPEGVDQRWQGDPDSHGVDDISFVDQMITYFQSNFCIDTSRIYASGMSNGGGLTAKLACDPALSKKIAAFAPVAGAYYTSTSETACSGIIPWTVSIDCNPGRAVPILEIHGSADNVIAYNGGPRRGWCLPAIPHYMTEWSVREGHGLTNKTTSLYSAKVQKYQWGEADGVLGVLTHYWVSGLGHDWPYKFGDAAFNATAVIMNFFEKWSLDSDTLGKATFLTQSALPSASASAQVSSVSSTNVPSAASTKASSMASAKPSSASTSKSSSTISTKSSSISAPQGYQAPSSSVQGYQASPSNVQAYQVPASSAQGYQGPSSSSKITSSKTKSTSTSSRTEAAAAKSSSKADSTVARASSAISSAAPSAYMANSGKITCPAAHNTYYSTGSSTYVVECGIDHAGGDMTVPNGQHSASLEDCIAACEARSGCVDLSYVRGNGACYLKSSVGKEVPNSGIIGAKKSAMSYAGAASSSNSASSSGKVSAAAAYDAAKSSSVNQAASSTAKASVVTTTVTRSSSSCSSKSSSSPVKPSIIAAYAVGQSSAASQAAATSTVAPTCPASNGTVSQDPAGKQYTVFCGYDTTGPVIGDPKYALGSFGNCINACGSVKGCVGVTYNGACYFKSANGQLVRSEYTAQHNIRAATLKT